MSRHLPAVGDVLLPPQDPSVHLQGERGDVADGIHPGLTGQQMTVNLAAAAEGNSRGGIMSRPRESSKFKMFVDHRA